MPLLFPLHSDGPAIINVNIYLRTISRIDDVKMVSELITIIFYCTHINFWMIQNKTSVDKVPSFTQTCNSVSVDQCNFVVVVVATAHVLLLLPDEVQLQSYRARG